MGEAPLMLSVSGCRGIVGASLTPITVAGFVAAATSWARSRGRGGVCVLARDGRRGGEGIAMLAAGALAAAGWRVVDLGVATTPTAGVMVRRLGAGMGLVITASHNPAIWNGLKVLSEEGGAPMPEDARAIIAAYHGGAAQKPGLWAGSFEAGSVERDDTSAKVHVDMVLEKVGALTALNDVRRRCYKVVLDSVNASGARAGKMLLEALGCRVVHLNDATSGEFPHPPEPVKENLTDLCGKVREHGADAGFAQDPDADRLAMIDERGAYIGEEYTLALGVRAWLSMLGEKGRGAAVAANLSTSRMVDDVCAGFGARVVRTAVGEANVVHGMKGAGSVMGGEGNGGVIWREIVPIRDSLSAMALTLALMAREDRPLSACAAAIPAYAIVKRKIDVKPGLSERAVAATAGHFAAKGASLNDSDGVRADFEVVGGGKAWVHVRASNTEPIIRLIAEAPRVEQAEKVLDEVGALVASC